VKGVLGKGSSGGSTLFWKTGQDWGKCTSSCSTSNMNKLRGHEKKEREKDETSSLNILQNRNKKEVKREIRKRARLRRN